MHDLKYAGQIMSVLKKEVGENKNAEVVIEACLSPLSHVTPKRLKELFRILSRDEGYTKAALNISITEFRMHCRECGKAWNSAEPVFKCPGCGGTGFELEKWEEFCIDSVKVER